MVAGILKVRIILGWIIQGGVVHQAQYLVELSKVGMIGIGGIVKDVFIWGGNYLELNSLKWNYLVWYYQSW